MNWPSSVVLAVPGLIIWMAGIVQATRATELAARLRARRTLLVGFGLFVLGLALSLVVDGIVRGNPILVAGPILVQGPIVVVFFWLAYQVRTPE